MATLPRSCAALLAPFVFAAVVVGDALPASAASDPKACKLLKPAAVSKVLGQQAAIDQDAETAAPRSVATCVYTVGGGLGEPGGAMVVLTYFKGVLADNIAAEFESRATALGGGAVWEPLAEAAYVAKKGKLVGVSVTYTADDPSTTELQDEMAKLAKQAAKRA